MALVALDPFDQVVPLDPHDASGPRDPLDPLAEVLTGRAGDAVEPGPGRGRDPCGPLVHVHRVGPRAAVTGVLEHPLPPEVADRLGVESLWAHQARAIDLARAGRSVVVATGTASGKSLCYQAPLAEAAALPVRRGTSLLVFPTKALAHDQLRALSAREFPGVVAGRVRRRHRRTRSGPGSGATPPRCSPTPRCCTAGCCPTTTGGRRSWGGCATSWSTSCTSSGASSARTSPTCLRRLRRLCHHYGADPTFVCCSATIGQPDRLAVGAVRPARRGRRRRRVAARPSGWWRCGTRRRSTR